MPQERGGERLEQEREGCEGAKVARWREWPARPSLLRVLRVLRVGAVPPGLAYGTRRDLHVSRLTAAKYLDALVDGGFLAKMRVGRSNYYVNLALYSILTGDAPLPAAAAIRP